MLIEVTMGEAIKVQVGDFVFYGYESPCPLWIKLKYREAVNFICQDCKKKELVVGTLEAHRVRRGVDGGLYTVLPVGHLYGNVKVLCHKCHQKYNYSRKCNY